MNPGRKAVPKWPTSHKPSGPLISSKWTLSLIHFMTLVHSRVLHLFITPLFLLLSCIYKYCPVSKLVHFVFCWLCLIFYYHCPLCMGPNCQRAQGHWHGLQTLPGPKLNGHSIGCARQTIQNHRSPTLQRKAAKGYVGHVLVKDTTAYLQGPEHPLPLGSEPPWWQTGNPKTWMVLIIILLLLWLISA